MGRINNPESKLVALVDSNVLVYALIKNYPDKERHEKCLTLLNKGLKGQLDYFLAVNPIIIAEVFTVLRKLLNMQRSRSKNKHTAQFKTHHLPFNFKGSMPNRRRMGKRTQHPRQRCPNRRIRRRTSPNHLHHRRTLQKTQNTQHNNNQPNGSYSLVREHQPP